MKKISILLAVVLIGNAALAQNAISRNWMSVVQTVDASFLKKKVKFKVTASAKVVSEDTTSRAVIWVRVDNRNGEPGFSDYMQDRQIRIKEWKTYTLEGTMDENAEKINFGAMCLSNGKFYFDNFELFVENDKGELQKANLTNAGFEMPITGNVLPVWKENSVLRPVHVKEFTLTSTNDRTEGKLGLMIEGKGISRDTTYLIGPTKGYSPQIGTLITMLNNLSTRVERTVSGLNPKETDHLLDEKANTIGALVMHLAAAEAYYQVFTFEGRQFNEEEKKKWQVALDLGDKAREEFRGHDISYYLDIYKEVRKKTVEELAKRDDAWLAKTLPDGDDFNNYFCWFHVMEHQSSHLGQILLLQKRLPQREEKAEIKVERAH